MKSQEIRSRVVGNGMYVLFHGTGGQEKQNVAYAELNFENRTHVLLRGI